MTEGDTSWRSGCDRTEEDRSIYKTNSGNFQTVLTLKEAAWNLVA